MPSHPPSISSAIMELCQTHHVDICAGTGHGGSRHRAAIRWLRGAQAKAEPSTVPAMHHAENCAAGGCAHVGEVDPGAGHGLHPDPTP